MAPEVSARIDRDAPIPRFTRAHPDRFLHPTAGTPGYPHRKIPRLTPRPFSLLAPRRHVVLPPDIAKLLPKGRLLSEVGYCSPRSGRDPPRPSFSDGGCELEIQRFPSRCTRATFGCERWFFKAFPPPDSPPPRALHSSSRARSLTIRSPFVHQAEWRGLGVQQSRGWVHYAIHRPEPHIMLYRCVSRPVPRALFSNRRGRGSRPILPPHPAAMRRSTRVARVRDDAVASGARIPRRRRTPRRRRRREGRRRGLGAVARKRPKRNTIGARLTNANATLTSSSPGYTQAHAQLRSARVVGCGQQGERAVSAGRGAWRRALWGTRAFERRRSATIGRDAPERRRRAKLDFEEGG